VIKKLDNLALQCCFDMVSVEEHIDKFMKDLSDEDLLQIIEVSKQPLLFEIEDPAEDPQGLLRGPARQVVENHVLRVLEHSICDMAYGDYLQLVDNWLTLSGHPESTQEELAIVDQLQCDLEPPGICGKAIVEIRNEVKV
jgi:hypothetical protein